MRAGLNLDRTERAGFSMMGWISSPTCDNAEALIAEILTEQARIARRDGRRIGARRCSADGRVIAPKNCRTSRFSFFDEAVVRVFACLPFEGCHFDRHAGAFEKESADRGQLDRKSVV